MRGSTARMKQLRGLLASLAEDVIAAREALSGSDTAVNRRHLVRATLVAVEGLVWEARQQLRAIAQDMGELTPLADLALQEQSYQVNSNGELIETVKYIPVATSIRLIVRQAKLLSPSADIDFSNPGWQKLRQAIDIRNRLTHPKNLQDLNVAEAEIDVTNASFEWLLAEITKLLQAIVHAFRDYRDDATTLIDALRRGDPHALQLYRQALMEES